MATVNLGRIKPTWQGAWNNSTQYVADDIVYYNNHAWISVATNTNSAPADGNSNWDKMANGASIPTGATSGQVLTAGASDTYTWETLPPSNDASALTQGTLSIDRMASGTIVKRSVFYHGTRVSLNGNSSDNTVWSFNYTKERSDTHILLTGRLAMRGSNCDWLSLWSSDGNTKMYNSISDVHASNSSDPAFIMILGSSRTAFNSGTYTAGWGWGPVGGGEACKPHETWNPNSTDDVRQSSGGTGSFIIVDEYVP